MFKITVPKSSGALRDNTIRGHALDKERLFLNAGTSVVDG
jgi:hypothetical protein